MEFNPVAIFLALPVLIASVLAIFTWGERFGVHARLFSVSMIAVGLWSATEAVMQAGLSLTVMVIFLKIQFLAVTSLPVWWLLVIMRYTGRERFISGRNILLLMIIPCFIVVMMATNELHHLVYSNISLDMTHSYQRIVLIRGPLFWINIGYSYLLIAGSLVFLFQRLLHHQSIYRAQAIYLLVALMVIISTNLVYLANVFPMENIDPLPFAFTLSGLIIVVGIVKYHVLDLVPVARGQIIENIMDAVVVMDRGGRLIDYNKPASEMFHWRKPQIGKPVADLWDDRPDILEYLSSVETVPETTLIVGKGDATKYHQVTSVEISDAIPENNGRIIVFHNITRLKQAESDLLAALDKEKAARESLELESRKRIDFSRTLIHELKTPLTPILASSELLSEGLDTEPWASVAGNIHRGAESLSRRIDELLDLAKGEIGKLQIVKKPIDLPTLLKDIVSEMLPLVTERSQSLLLDPLADLPVVMADEVRLRQIIQNLITNAIKFTGSGGKITVRAFHQNTDIVIEVQDNGNGLTSEEQTRLFQAYERLDAEDKRLSGLGLGLSLCKNLVELHGGRIWVYSEKGKGSIFAFSLPVSSLEQVKV